MLELLLLRSLPFESLGRRSPAKDLFPPAVPQNRQPCPKTPNSVCHSCFQLVVFVRDLGPPTLAYVFVTGQCYTSVLTCVVTCFLVVSFYVDANIVFNHLCVMKLLCISVACAPCLLQCSPASAVVLNALPLRLCRLQLYIRRETVHVSCERSLYH